MTHAHSSVAEIFSNAVALQAGDEQAAYLDSACGTNSELRKRVERLLLADNKAHDFLESPAIRCADTITAVGAESPGTQIGPYRLLEQIGEGGMGMVYMAEQEQPVRRKVALKVIKPGMDSGHVIARFEAERQALAMMDHVNIARVLDAGTTEQGRPYFVMELVNGVSITKYCDDNRLTPRERLELFVPICQAIQHAHQKGIIHRDIKPSNVMITLYDGKPVPKVIDFGVAKATEQRLTERTLFTQYGTMVGTLEYMSPEQAEMSALGVDTRSDIYSLGVLLYELLTGSTPLSRKRIKEAAFAEILRMIKEQEPPRPSTRLSESGEALASISAQRSTQPASLSKLMRGELDWIVMKCLEKDRNRRYETANGFAADVQRYLSYEPVQACPPSAVYRFRKFVRRNKGLAAATAIVLVVLLSGIAGTTWGLVQAEQGRRASESARRTANAQRKEAVAQRTEAVAHLYDSLIGEARALRLARGSGYRAKTWQRLRQAAQLDTPNRNLDEIRREAAACLGDFVGLEPTVLKVTGEKRISSIALHPTAPHVAIGYNDGSLSVRRLPDGAEIHVWTGRENSAIRAVEFDAGGVRLASAAADRTIVLWEPTDDGWAAVWTYSMDLPDGAIPAAAMAIVFAPDGKQLSVCARGDSTIQTLHTEQGRPLDRRTVPNNLSGSMALSPNGKLLAAGYGGQGNHAIRVWDLTTGEVIQDILSRLHEVNDLRFSANGKLLACGCDSGTAVFDSETLERLLFFHSANIFDAAFSPDGQLLACGTHGATRLLDVATNREVAMLLQPRAEEDPSWSDFVRFVALSNDGKTIMSASHKRILLWDLDGASERVLLKRCAGGIPGVAFSPLGNLLAGVSYDRSVTLWNPSTRQLVRSLKGCEGQVQAVAFSPNGRLLATGDWSGGESVRLWDINTGDCLHAIAPELGSVWSVGFSGEGRFFAAGGERGWVIWKFEDTEDGTRSLQVVTRRRTAESTGCLSFTPDGSLLAWVEQDSTFHLWDLIGKSELPAPVNKLAGYVTTIAYDLDFYGPQDRSKWLRLWTLQDQESGEIWDMATGQRLASDAPWSREYAVLPEKIYNWSRALSPDKTMWAVGTGDGNLVLWDLNKVHDRLEEAGLGWDKTPPPSGMQN